MIIAFALLIIAKYTILMVRVEHVLSLTMLPTVFVCTWDPVVTTIPNRINVGRVETPTI